LAANPLSSYINRHVNAGHTAGFSGVVWANTAAVMAVWGGAPGIGVFLGGFVAVLTLY
jgi:hypothetical protein